MPIDVLVATGHRPPALGGYDDKVTKKLVQLAKKVLEQHEPHTVVSGMALGWDQAIAHAAVAQNRHLIAVVPFQGYESRWPLGTRRLYARLLHDAQLVQFVSPTPHDNRDISNLMRKRNLALLEYAQASDDHVVAALWNKEPNGGTAHCVGAAMARGLKIVNYYPSWVKYGPGLPPVPVKGGKRYQKIRPDDSIDATEAARLFTAAFRGTSRLF